MKCSNCWLPSSSACDFLKASASSSLMLLNCSVIMLSRALCRALCEEPIYELTSLILCIQLLVLSSNRSLAALSRFLLASSRSRIKYYSRSSHILLSYYFAIISSLFLSLSSISFYFSFTIRSYFVRQCFTACVLGMAPGKHYCISKSA